MRIVFLKLLFCIFLAGLLYWKHWKKYEVGTEIDEIGSVRCSLREMENNFKNVWNTELPRAAELKQYSRLIWLVEENKWNINSRDNWGKTAMYYVAKQGEFHLIPFLHKRGASLDLPCLKGSTPLMAVAENQNLDNALQTIKFLLHLGADPTIRNSFGYSAFEFAVLPQTRKYLGTEIMKWLKNENQKPQYSDCNLETETPISCTSKKKLRFLSFNMNMNFTNVVLQTQLPKLLRQTISFLRADIVAMQNVPQSIDSPFFSNYEILPKTDLDSSSLKLIISKKWIITANATLELSQSSCAQFSREFLQQTVILWARLSDNEQNYIHIFNTLIMLDKIPQDKYEQSTKALHCLMSQVLDFHKPAKVIIALSLGDTKQTTQNQFIHHLLFELKELEFINIDSTQFKGCFGCVNTTQFSSTVSQNDFILVSNTQHENFYRKQQTILPIMCGHVTGSDFHNPFHHLLSYHHPLVMDTEYCSHTQTVI